MVWIYATLPLAALFGLCISSYNSCAVASMERLVLARELRDVGLKALAMLVAAFVLMAWQASAATPPRLPAAQDTMTVAVAGGIILGLGASLNGACFVGTVMRAAQGRIGFLLTIVGMYGALLVYPEIYVLPTEGARPRADWIKLDWPWLAAALLPAMLVALLFRRISGKPIRYAGAAVLSGISGALLFGLDPQWTYLAALDRVAHGAPPRQELIAAYLLIGSVIGAWSANRIRLSGFNLREVGLKIAGGFAMGFGALIIPGGNEAILFWGMPTLALHALAAYAAMMVTIAAILAWARPLRPQERLDG